MSSLIRRYSGDIAGVLRVVGGSGQFDWFLVAKLERSSSDILMRGLEVSFCFDFSTGWKRTY